MKRDIRVAPSVLSADVVALADAVAAVEAGGADWIHVDVMDGTFVPNLTFGPEMIGALKRLTDLPLDVHLMVQHPESYLTPCADAGAAVFTFHAEATVHTQRLLDEVRERGLGAGLALNPGTPLTYAEEVVDDLDLLLVMTVNPGFAGQRYIPASTRKISRARELLDRSGSGARLEVDGGISRDTIGAAAQAGADTFVAGSAIFGSDDPAEEIRMLRQRCHPTV